MATISFATLQNKKVRSRPHFSLIDSKNHGRAGALLRYRVSGRVSGVITMAVNVA